LSDGVTLINAYQRVAGEAIFEIGRRLKHVKENDLVHGEFGKWLESIEMNHSTANKMMKVVTELGGKSDTYPKMNFNLLVQIATMPEDQRTQPHTIPSTGATKTVDEMTVRELREVKKVLCQAEKLIHRHHLITENFGERSLVEDLNHSTVINPFVEITKGSFLFILSSLVL
jgi:hypothetical protein